MPVMSAVLDTRWFGRILNERLWLRYFCTSDLFFHPRIKKVDPVFEIDFRLPTDGINAIVRKIAGMHPDRATHMLDVDTLTRDLGNGMHKLVDCHILRTANIHGALQVRVHQHVDSIDHVADVRIGSDGGSVTPYFDRAAI